MQKADNWLFFSESYFETTKFLVKNRQNLNKKQKYILFPALFNFKHGIECFLKFLSVSLIEEKENNHDIKYLFEELEKELYKEAGKIDLSTNKQKVIKIITKKLEDNKSIEFSIKEVVDTMTFFFNKENKILELVKDYQSCAKVKDISNYCNQNSIEDKYNEVFRYPDSRAIRKGEIKYQDFIDDFAQRDWDNFLKDVCFLEESLYSLGCVIEFLAIIKSEF